MDGVVLAIVGPFGSFMFGWIMLPTTILAHVNTNTAAVIDSASDDCYDNISSFFCCSNVIVVISKKIKVYFFIICYDITR